MKTDRPVALITGGRGTLAQALVKVLAAAGWEVHAPPRARLDVRDPDSIHRVISSMARIDLLVNNAAIRRDAPFIKLAAASWDDVLDTNLRGAWHCCRAVLPVMHRQGGGHIINLSSHTARHGAPGQTAYGASKAGLLALTQSLAAEAGLHNIRVNAVLPGWMPTAFNQDLPPAVHETARLQHALQRFNTPEDTARFMLHLHGMPHTSGQVFQLDSRRVPGSELLPRRGGVPFRLSLTGFPSTLLGCRKPRHLAFFFMPDSSPNAILCFDFDGTLVENPSDPYEIAQLEQILTHMGKRGAVWGINTGRTLFHTLDGLKQHGFRLSPDFIIARECEVYHQNEYRRWVDLGDWNKRCANDHKKFYKNHAGFFKQLQKHLATHWPGARFISDQTEPAGLVVPDDDIMAGICHWIDAQLPAWPGLGYQRNSIWLRFTHQGYHKGSALQEIRRLMEIGPEYTFAAGDNYNDLSMLQHEVAHGIACPGNAIPDVVRHVDSLGGYLAAEEATLGMISALHYFFYNE